ncbi:hypothetical protein ACFL4T_08520 [candidate division KSB1 bacterium]
MRSIRYILLSYLQQEFINVFYISVGILGFFLSLSDIFIDKEPFPSCWYRFLWIVIMLVPASAFHLKRLILSDSGFLVPNYRKYQVITACMIYIPLILFPPLLAILHGYQFLNYFAMMLISVSLLVWIRLIFNDPGYLTIFTLIPLWLIYEMLDFEKNLALVSSFNEITGIESESFLPIILIIISFILIYHLFIHIFRKPGLSRTNKNEIYTDPLLFTHDKIDSFSGSLITKKVSRLLNRIKGGKTPVFQIIRLFQYSLFNPESTMFLSTTLLIFTGIGLGGGFLLLSMEEIPRVFFDYYTLPVFFLFYQVSAGIISSDFFQHRNRMPVLWIQSSMTRNKFIKTVISTYLFVAFKLYIKLTAVFMFLLWIFEIAPAVSVYQFLLLGFFLYIIIISFSLLVSEYNVSFSSFGWILFHMIMIWPIFGLNLLLMRHLNMSLNSWIFISVTGVFSGILLLMAFRKFEETEMNFTGPGV